MPETCCISEDKRLLMGWQIWLPFLQPNRRNPSCFSHFITSASSFMLGGQVSVKQRAPSKLLATTFVFLMAIKDTRCFCKLFRQVVALFHSCLISLWGFPVLRFASGPLTARIDHEIGLLISIRMQYQGWRTWFGNPCHNGCFLNNANRMPLCVPV